MQNYENFEGPSDDELREAYRRSNEQRLRQNATISTGRQSAPQRWKGTPRKGKHQQRFEGLRIS